MIVIVIIKLLEIKKCTSKCIFFIVIFKIWRYKISNIKTVIKHNNKICFNFLGKDVVVAPGRVELNGSYDPR